MERIRWGIIGAGEIVDRWMRGAKQLKEVEIRAIASRTLRHAQQKAEAYAIPKVFLTMEALLQSDEVDAVYIALTHPYHKMYTMLALEHGKHVLVEKPMAVTAEDAQQMIQCAKKHDKLLMEAMWTRCFPLYSTIRELEGEQGIGQFRAVSATFSYGDSNVAASGRNIDPKQAGGGLLDVGVYCLHFASFVFQANPESVCGVAALSDGGRGNQIDEQNALSAVYSGGRIAALTSGVRTEMYDTAFIFGTKGSITIPEFWRPTRIHVEIGEQTHSVEKPVNIVDSQYIDEGFQYEILHFEDCIREGRRESPCVPLEDSLATMRCCDELRRSWGLIYPCEEGTE